VLASELFYRLIELGPELEHVNSFQRADYSEPCIGVLFFFKLLIRDQKLDIIKGGVPALKILSHRK
jgi:hypothetical protein